MKTKLGAALLFGLVLLGVTPASADVMYTVNYHHAGFVGSGAVITGYITTDGTIGALRLADIMSWHITIGTETQFGSNQFVQMSNYGSDIGFGVFDWYPNSLSASATSLVYNNTIGGLSIGGWSFSPPGIPTFFDPHPPGRICADSICSFATFQTYIIAADGATVVPSPIIGAGLPGLILAALGLLGFNRRRRNAA